MLDMISENYLAFNHVGQRLLENERFVLNAVERNAQVLDLLSEERFSKEFIQKARAQVEK